MAVGKSIGHLKMIITLNYLESTCRSVFCWRLYKILVEGKQYHIITTNADNALDAEYDMTHVFSIQGEYILQQCSQHCHAPKRIAMMI